MFRKEWETVCIFELAGTQTKTEKANKEIDHEESKRSVQGNSATL